MGAYAQGRRRYRLQIDLFPFLAIIVCVIGIIVLLISGMIAGGAFQEAHRAEAEQLQHSIAALESAKEVERGAGQAKSKAQSAQDLDHSDMNFRSALAAATRDFERANSDLADLTARALFGQGETQDLRQRLETLDADFGRLPDRIDGLKDTSARMSRALSAMRPAFAAADLPRASSEEIEARAARAAAEKAKQMLVSEQSAWAAAKEILASPDFSRRIALAVQVQNLSAQLQQVRAEAATLPEQLKKARELATDAENAITIPDVPPGSRVQPIWIECHPAGLSIFRLVDDNVDQVDVATDAIDNSTELREIVANAAADAGRGGPSVLNILVRPGGVKNRNHLMNVISGLSAPYTEIPLPAARKVRFATRGRMPRPAAEPARP